MVTEHSAAHPRGTAAAPAARRPGGRSARVRRAVLDATVEILVSTGFDTLTIAKVAERSGVHATSIYRRWGTPTSLALEALLDRLQVEVPDPDTGSLHDDLLHLARDVAAFVRTPLGRTLLHLAVRTDVDRPDLDLDQARQQFWATRAAVVGRILHRAAARGQVRAGVPVDTVLELLAGPLHLRLLLTRQPVDDAFLHRVVDLLVHGIAADGPARERGPATFEAAPAPRPS